MLFDDIYLNEFEGVCVHFSYSHSVRAVAVIPDWSNVTILASDWSQRYPSRKTVTSMLRMSPNSSGLASGIPCAATLFTSNTFLDGECKIVQIVSNYLMWRCFLDTR